MADDEHPGGALTLTFSDTPAALSPDEEKLIEAARRLVVKAICQRINAKLGAQHVFSEPLQELLYRAWSLATQLRNMDVGIDHVIVAYATSDAALNDRFTTPLGDRIVPLAGAMTRLAGQRAVLGPPQTIALLPHDALATWLREAGLRASARGATSVDLATDFIGVITDPHADAAAQKAIHDTIDRTSDAERTRAQLDRARRDLDSMRITAGHHRKDILAAMDKLAGTVTQSLAGTVAEVKSVTDGLAKSQSEAIARVNKAADQQRTDAATGITALTDTMRSALAETHREFKALTEATAGKQEAVLVSLNDAAASIGATLQSHRNGIAQDLHRVIAEVDKAKSAPNAPTMFSPLWILGAMTGVVALGLVLGSATFAYGPKLLKMLQ